MTDKPIVLVWGSTGSQGGSVARALLKDGTYTVRAATRNISSDQARALASLGAELVAVDMTHEAQVCAACKGVDAVFAVTNHQDPVIGPQEMEVGSRLARAAKEAGVKHYIWSTLPSVTQATNGQMAIPDYDMKAAVNDVISGLGFAHSTFVRLAFYFENHETFFTPTEDPDGTVVFAMAIRDDAPVPMVSINDLGRWVLAALQSPKKYGDGAILNVCSEVLTYAEVVSRFTQATGRKARFQYLSGADLVATFGDDIGEQIRVMDKYVEEYGYYADGKGHNNAVPDAAKWEDYLASSQWWRKQ